MAFTPITLYFLYFVFSRPDSQLCTSQNRTDTCTQEEWNPVCALYSGPHCNSPTGYCYKTLLRTCDACLDSDILGYAPGECEEPTFPQQCTPGQVGDSCSDDEDVTPVCGYSKTDRFRGKNSVSKAFSSGCEACSSEQSVFNVPGECKDLGEIGICRLSKANAKCSEDNIEPLCAYYYGAGCTESMCRKTVTQSGCGVCSDSLVLFYVKGSCESVEAVSENVEELILDDLTDDQELPVLELESTLQEDGTFAYEEVKAEKQEIDDVEQQDDIPELEAVIQEDGSVVYEEVVRRPPQKRPIYVDCVVEQQDYIPELEAVLQEDGTYMYEEVQPQEKKDDVPELEAIIQEDVTVYEPVTPKTETVEEPVVQKKLTILRKKADALLKKVIASGTDIPVIESILQEEVKPEVPEEGVVLCVEVETPTEEVEPYVANEEMVVREDGEFQLGEPQQVEIIQMIETRLLVEPDN